MSPASSSQFVATMQRLVTSRVVLLGYMVGILLFSILPGADDDADFLRWRVSGPVASTLHVVIYAGLGWLWTRYFQARSFSTLAATLAAVGIGAAYGLMNELLQLYVPGRSGSVGDELFNLLGAIGGALFAAQMSVRR